MDLKVKTEGKITKKLFSLKLKTKTRAGLFLRIHHTETNSEKLRFLQQCFNNEGNLLASSDNDGNLFFIDLRSCKFWSLPAVNSCTFIAFSPIKLCEILVGQRSNEILVLNFENGKIATKLYGHRSPPSCISFSSFIYCLTSSATEAIIWNLEDNTKLKMLALEKGSLLLYVKFLPKSFNIVGFYTDNTVNIWKIGSFEIVKTIPRTTWSNINIKNCSVSNDDAYMALSGIDPCVIIYSLKVWKIWKFINLPVYVKTIRSLQFLSDYKSNRIILAILSGHGLLLFCDLVENTIISELKTQNEILKFDHSGQTKYLSCLLCTGEIEIYDVSMYVELPAKVTAVVRKKQNIKLKQKFSLKGIEALKEEVNEMLNIDKLRSILKEYGEYPENYRTMIWEQLLQLPYNTSVYDAIIKYRSYAAFENLNKEYPIENRSFKSLRCLLNNLVTWCGFFAHVHYLPVFAYPFVKVFQNRPIVAFEAVATILLNWCQYWFEYFPLPPINVLAIIENIFFELDPYLLNHIHNKGITSKQYAWSLLESAFSEILTSQSWFVFWDHVLTNEPAFLICTVVAYNIVQRKILLKLNETKDIEDFYHKQNPVDMKRFLSKCYKIMDATNPDLHPRKYLNMFTSIDKGSYPVFHGYPKIVVENEAKKLNDLKNELSNIKLEETKLLLDQKKQINRMLDIDLESIEKKRFFEMKKCREQLEEDQINAKQQIERLTRLSKKFDEHNFTILDTPKEDPIVPDISVNESETITNIPSYFEEKTGAMLLRHYTELIKHKMQIETLLKEESSTLDETELHETIRREHIKIIREIEKISCSPDAEKRIRQYNAVSSLLAMDDLIKRVESALAKELSSEYLDLSKSETCFKNIHLQRETEQLLIEVRNLLNVLSGSKIEKTYKVLTNDNIQLREKEYDRCPLSSSMLDSKSTISSGAYPLSSKLYDETDYPRITEEMGKFKNRENNKSVRFRGANHMNKSC